MKYEQATYCPFSLAACKNANVSRHCSSFHSVLWYVQVETIYHQCELTQNLSRPAVHSLPAQPLLFLLYVFAVFNRLLVNRRRRQFL